MYYDLLWSLSVFFCVCCFLVFVYEVYGEFVCVSFSAFVLFVYRFCSEMVVEFVNDNEGVAEHVAVE